MDAAWGGGIGGTIVAGAIAIARLGAAYVIPPAMQGGWAIAPCLQWFAMAGLGPPGWAAVGLGTLVGAFYQVNLGVIWNATTGQ